VLARDEGDVQKGFMSAGSTGSVAAASAMVRIDNPNTRQYGRT
jgi:hypothetical protein